MCVLICPACGMPQDEPQGLKRCGACGSPLDMNKLVEKQPLTLDSFLKGDYFYTLLSFVRHHVILGNGMELSIQASPAHHSEPNDIFKIDWAIMADLNKGRMYCREQHWTSFEVMSIGFNIPEFEEYYNDPMYSYVPREVLENYINDNGGILGVCEVNNDNL